MQVKGNCRILKDEISNNLKYRNHENNTLEKSNISRIHRNNSF
jgi:hypothetical protein